MKRIKLDISTCEECPFIRYSDGEGFCKLSSDPLFPLIPNYREEIADFCPLPDIEEVE